VSAIRPLERSDLPTVARLYERVLRSGGNDAPPGLADYFARTLLDHPWADPELPSLVYEQKGRGIVGMMGSYVRRIRSGERTLRMRCGGQLAADPSVTQLPIGTLLLRQFLGGPQDLSITDGATDEVRKMWEALGGKANALTSTSWTRVLRPVSFTTNVAARLSGRVEPVAPGVAAAVDRAGHRALPIDEAGTSSEPLNAAAMLDELARLDNTFPVRVAYDADFLGWLFNELAAVIPRGKPAARLVRAADGQVLGWYILYVQKGGISQVLQVAAGRHDLAAVIANLLGYARQAGAAAVQGRLEPHLYPFVRSKWSLFRRTEWALVHTADPELLAAIGFGGALLTRLDGEWWMGHHLLTPAQLGSGANRTGD
jgi:hypothetical protein